MLQYYKTKTNNLLKLELMYKYLLSDLVNII